MKKKILDILNFIWFVVLAIFLVIYGALLWMFPFDTLWKWIKKAFKFTVEECTYRIELVSQLFITFVAAIDYGIIEAKYIPTSTGNFPTIPILGNRFSYYHIFLLIQTLITSFAFTIIHLRWIITNRKKYVLFMSLGCIPLWLMLEDLTWFVTLWRPIKKDEWTMICPGLGFDAGFSWIPLWYIIALAISITMFWLGNRYANKGYDAYLNLTKANKLSA